MQSKLPKMLIEYEVKDADGKIVKKGKQKANSWLGNIIGLIYALVSGTTTGTSSMSAYYGSTASSLVDVSGSARGLFLAYTSGNTRLGGNAPAGEGSYGILVGASDTPNTIATYNLGSKIAHGTDAGQLVYDATTVESLIKDASWYFRVVRTFTNQSGGTVTIREIGLVLQLFYAAGGLCQVLFARDVLTSPINVGSGQTLTVRYIISYSLT